MDIDQTPERDLTPLLTEKAEPVPTSTEYGFASAQRVKMNQRTFGARWFKITGAGSDGADTAS